MSRLAHRAADRCEPWLVRLARTLVLSLFLSLAGCKPSPPIAAIAPTEVEPPAALSAYGLFRGDLAGQEPAEGVVPYDVNTPLFSDHALKLRFVRLPTGQPASYSPSTSFEFPVGTILVKTFAYPHDFRDFSRGRRLIETRLLVREADGWAGRTYVWNDAQTDAALRLAGADCDVRWTDFEGRVHELRYLVPNANQCLGCHENRKVMKPIGTTARNLNRPFPYAGVVESQLDRWIRSGMLIGAPSIEHVPHMPVWNKPSSGSLEERARAWLDSNCAHCHNADGPARNSGLDLSYQQQDLFKRGFWKPPVAAGRGSGGRSFGVVPGKPDESILVFRIESREPGIMMPEHGRRLVDEEGVALVRAWIASLPPTRP